MTKLRKSGPPTEVFSAEERAAVLEQEIVELIEAGKFRFRAGWGYYSDTSVGPCGCALGALVAVTGGGDHEDWRPHDEIAATGLATVAELEDLEQGYEFGEDDNSRLNEHCRKSTDRGPFFSAGQRLRARPDARPTWEPK